MARAETLENSSKTNSPTFSQEKSFDNTISFVSDPRVSSSPIDARTQAPPRHPQMTKEQWERGWEIIGEYLGTDKTLKEIGKKHHFTKENVRLVVKKRIKHLHQIQNAEVKEEYPLEQLSYFKPLSIRARRRISKVRGGKSLKIEQALSEGKTVSQLKVDLKLDQIGDARRVLDGWGIEVPYELSHILPRFMKLKDPELSDEEKQKLLDRVKHHGELNVLSSGKEPLIIPVSKIGRKAGLIFSNAKVNTIYTLLRDNNIPASTYSHVVRSRGENKKQTIFTYYFICTTDIDRAIEIINSEKEFDQFRINPVTVLSTTTNRIPRIGELQDSGDYAHLGSLIVEIRGRGLSRHIKAEDIFLDCPVPIFQYGKHGSIFYRLDQQKQLKIYIMERLRELGLK